MNVSFRVGEFLIEPPLNNISSRDKSVHVEPKVMHVLTCLADKPGEVVSKENLIRIVWADTFVTDDVLTRAISELRKVFGDDSKEPRYIQTIPRTGYRLIAPVVNGQSDVQTDSTVHVIPATTSPLRRLIWVVPLLLVISGASWLYFSQARSGSRNASMRVVPFTSYPGREDQGVLSPDGNQIAFAWAGEKHDNVDIYVKSISGEKPLRVTTSPAIDLRPAWSPDGQRICFIRIPPNGPSAVFVASVLGAAPERMLFQVNHKASTLAWSPDGKFIATSDAPPQSNATGIVLFSPDTGEKRVLTTPPVQYWADFTPAFSPDSKSVAFVRMNSPITGDIYVVPVSGGESRRITHDNARHEFDGAIFGGVTWTQDGSELVFSSTRGGTPSLWRVAVAGGEPERLPVGGDNSYYPSVSLQGHRLSYTRVSGGTPIYRIDVGEPTQRKLSTKLLASTQNDALPRYSLDGKRIAFQSDRSGSPEIWVCDSNGQNLTQLTFFRKGVAGTPQWSPDSRQIAFDYRASGMADVYVINVDGGVPRRITTEDSDDSLPSWSRDGRSLYFASNRSGSSQIWKTPVDGGPLLQVTKQVGFSGFESSDGRYVYYSKGTFGHGVWRVPVQGGEEVQVLCEGGAGSWGQWMLADNGIYYIDYHKDSLSIAFFDFASKKTKSIVALENVNEFIGGLTASPDGSHVLYTQQDPVNSDIMLVEDFR